MSLWISVTVCCTYSYFLISRLYLNLVLSYMLLKQVWVFALGLHMLSLGHLFYFFVLVVPFCVPCLCSDLIRFLCSFVYYLINSISSIREAGCSYNYVAVSLYMLQNEAKCFI